MEEGSVETREVTQMVTEEDEEAVAIIKEDTEVRTSHMEEVEAGSHKETTKILNNNSARI